MYESESERMTHTHTHTSIYSISLSVFSLDMRDTICSLKIVHKKNPHYVLLKPFQATHTHTQCAYLVMQKQCGVCGASRRCACGSPGPEVRRRVRGCCVKSTARSQSGNTSCDSAAETPCGKTWCSLAPGT